MEQNTGVDSLQIFLTGGLTNRNPSLSLGGTISSTPVSGLGCVITSGVPGLQILDVNGTCGEGEGTIICSTDDTATFTAPNDTIGDAVSITEGETKVLQSNNTAKTIKIFRNEDMDFIGTAAFSLVSIVRGVLSMNYIENAERISGGVKYRAIAITNSAENPLLNINISIGNSSELQAVYSFGSELPISNSAQTIINESTPPIGITFTSSLSIPTLEPDSSIIIWISRVFPSSGTVSAKESPELLIGYQGE